MKDTAPRHCRDVPDEEEADATNNTQGNDILEELQDDNQLDNDQLDVVPLVARDGAPNKIIHPLELMDSDGEDESTRQYRRLACCLALTPILIVIILLRVFYIPQVRQEANNRYSPPPPQPIDNFRTAADKLQCAQDLNISFAQLFFNMQQETNFCDMERPDCRCVSPLQPRVGIPPDGQGYQQLWNTTFERNKQLAMSINKTLHVVLLGDSITEHWLGTDLSRPNKDWKENVAAYQHLFHSAIQGLALGIGGDRCPQMLQRIRFGEMPSTLQSSVWWLLIGTNDLADSCRSDVILAGILHIVQDININRPGSTIVINGILPRPADKSGVLQHKDGRPSLWTKISWINERLACFAQAFPARIQYFNASDVFLYKNHTSDDDSNEVYFVNHDLMDDYLHPNGRGSEQWGELIVDKVIDIVGTTRQAHTRR